jgi:hypothetical protein
LISRLAPRRCHALSGTATPARSTRKPASNPTDKLSMVLLPWLTSTVLLRERPPPRLGQARGDDLRDDHDSGARHATRLPKPIHISSGIQPLHDARSNTTTDGGGVRHAVEELRGFRTAEIALHTWRFHNTPAMPFVAITSLVTPVQTGAVLLLAITAGLLSYAVIPRKTSCLQCEQTRVSRDVSSAISP